MPGPPACSHRGRRRHRLELADLVRTYGDRLRATRPLTGEQLAALRAIERCRTPALGGCREVCANCGKQRFVWRSCRNRHCPKCQTLAKERWLQARVEELLPVDYVHVVFTLPHELNAAALRCPRLIYGQLFRAATDTLRDFARDQRYLGAEPGIVAVLHTWGQNLSLHIHLHCIVTAGGLDPTRRRWIRRPGGYLFPVRALSRTFRGKYLEGLRRAQHEDPKLPSHHIPSRELWRQDWVVYAKKPFAGPRRVLEYLARYTHRVALTNNRLLGLRNGIVRLRWRDYAYGGKKKVLRLSATDLLGRFVLHVLPRGFQRVRHYGLLGNRHKTSKLAACRHYFGIEAPSEVPQQKGVDPTTALLRRLGIEPDRCHICGSRRIRRELLVPTPICPRARAPTRSVP